MPKDTMPKERENTIGESTPVSFKLVMALVGGFFGVSGALVNGVLWASRVEAKSNYAATQVDILSAKEEARYKREIRMERSLVRIEGALHISPDRSDD